MLDSNFKYSPASDETLKDYASFKKMTGMSESDIKSLCYLQSIEGITFVSQYRNLLQADFVLYKNVTSGEDRIGDTTLFNKINTLIARDYKDTPTVLFDSNDISTKDVATYCNAVYKDDYEEDNMEIINYYSRWFKYLFGVGIKSKIGWD